VQHQFQIGGRNVRWMLRVGRQWLGAPVSSWELARGRRALAQPASVEQAWAAIHALRSVGATGRARDVAERAIAEFGPHESIVHARRHIPGYVGSVPDELVLRAARAAGGLGRGPTTAIPIGRGTGVDVVVRHDIGAGRSMVRKSFVSAHDAELAAYRSAFVRLGGTRWRAPVVYELADAPDGSWHLFVEDVGTVARRFDGATMIDVAFAIDELNGASLVIGDGDADGSDRAPPSHRSTAAPVSPQALWLPDPDDVDRDGALGALVGTGLARAAHALVVGLAERREALVRRLGVLPTVFLHGDPTPGNVGSVGGRRVLLDWASSGRAPVGTDLAQLLQVPNRLVDGRPRLPAECFAAYGRGLRRSAGSAAPSDEDVEVGYLFRMMSGSLRWQIHQLRTARSWPGLTENLSRLTRDGERLLELLGR